MCSYWKAHDLDPAMLEKRFMRPATLRNLGSALSLCVLEAPQSVDEKQGVPSPPTYSPPARPPL